MTCNIRLAEKTKIFLFFFPVIFWALDLFSASINHIELGSPLRAGENRVDLKISIADLNFEIDVLEVTTIVVDIGTYQESSGLQKIERSDPLNVEVFDQIVAATLYREIVEVSHSDVSSPNDISIPIVFGTAVDPEASVPILLP